VADQNAATAGLLDGLDPLGSIRLRGDDEEESGMTALSALISRCETAPATDERDCLKTVFAYAYQEGWVDLDMMGIAVKFLSAGDYIDMAMLLVREGSTVDPDSILNDCATPALAIAAGCLRARVSHPEPILTEWAAMTDHEIAELRMRCVEQAVDFGRSDQRTVVRVDDPVALAKQFAAFVFEGEPQWGFTD
jgi:hypothetical protein